MDNYIHRGNWYEYWFDNNYLKLYHHRNLKDADEQVQLIINIIKPEKHHSILDLACGEGRHCLLFHKKGYQIKGIDLSATLIRSGKVKHPDLDIGVGDMRHIKGKHDIILSLFTSFGYFDKDRDNISVIFSISRALHPGGWFWIDFLNPEYLKSNLVPDNDLILADGTKVNEKRFFENNSIVKVITFHGQGSNKKYQERVKLYTKKDLEKMLLRAGIHSIDAFGDYKGEEWSSCSPRTIIYGRKTCE
ncbi:MAG: class I SAM-dependent methyltransferase [Spirochaetales bacterium]|nr:class I SAM-dependent methyltransferase [Spirochaetales bacterium]